MTLFHDVKQGAGPTDVDKANRASIGTIELSQSARMITRIWATAVNVGTDAQSKPLVGYITLESDDCKIEPFHFPFPPTPSHLGATPHSSRNKAKKFIVNCPCPGGTKITAYATLGVAAPQAAPEVFVTIEYSDGETYGNGVQVHMEILEPSAGLSTGDGDVTALTDIEVRGGSMLILVWAVAAVATIVADESVICGAKITCNEFKVSGPLNFGLEPVEGGDATTSGTHLNIAYVETNREFTQTRANIKSSITQYDANNAAPEIYVGVAYI